MYLNLKLLAAVLAGIQGLLDTVRAGDTKYQYNITKLAKGDAVFVNLFEKAAPYIS